MNRIVVTGTDTGVGKTVIAAGLAGALGATYWKPVQAGLSEATDTESATELAGCPTHPEAYRLRLPASPHLAAEDMRVTISLDALALPPVSGPLVIEGAGGVMVPLNRQSCFLDLFAWWKVPVVLVARTALGTINHTALSLAALRGAGCPVVGVVFNGAPEPQVEETITGMCRVAHLGRVPPLAPLTRETLASAIGALDLATIRAAL